MSRDICKGAITIITIEHIDTEIGHVKIDIPVVVVIGARCALSIVAAVANACSQCDVGKSSITVVTVECTKRFICCGRVLPIAAVNKVDVQVPVPVGIEEGTPSTKGFGQVICPFSAIDVPKIDARLRSHINELDRCRVAISEPTDCFFADC